MATIQGVYLALFGRPADPLGLAFFNTATNNGTNLSAIGPLQSSAEYQARFTGMSNAQIINSIYKSLFNRDADLPGLTYFSDALSKGTLNIANIAIAIYDGAQGADKTTLALKEAAANAFTAAIDTTAEVVGYSGQTAITAGVSFIAGVTTAAPSAAEVNAAVAAATTGGSGSVGINRALTATADVYVDGTANSDTFYGFINTTANSTDSTFAAVDVIDAKGGVDSLNITVVGSAAVTSLPAASITNVEKLFVRDLNAGGQSTYDVSSITGLTEVWNDRSTQAVDFVGLAAGTVIGVKGDGSNAVGQNDAAYAGSTVKSATIILDSVKGINGSFSVNNNTIETVTISSIGSANERSSLTLAGSGGTLKSLTIDASSNLTSDLATADYVAAGADLVVKGTATSVKLGAGGTFKTIDASAFAGGITITTDNNITSSVKGGAGNDVITYAGSTSTATIALGAGDDRLTGTFSSPLASGISVDGGAGTDTINSDAISLSNAAKFLNFEVLELGATGLDVNALTGSTLTKLVLAGAGGGTFNNVAAGLGLEVTTSSSGATINVKDAGTNATDTLAVTFAGAAQTSATTVAAGTVVANGIEAVTIASGGGANNANTITLTDDKLKTVTITGDKDLSLAFAGTNGTNTAAAAGGAVNLIDGSAATGKLTISTANVTADDKSGVGLTVKGGSAADTLTITVAATVDSGAGNDVITLSKKATVTAGAGDDAISVSSEGGTITGGDGKDVVDVKAAVYGASKVITTITDFVAGTDKLTLLDKGTEVYTATIFDKGTAGTLAEVLDLMAAGDGSTNGIVKWVQLNGDTYLVEDVSSQATLQAADIVVKLTGTVDLSGLTVSSFTFA